jgi:hypothetical protein
MRHIPSKKMLRERLWSGQVNREGFDLANATLTVILNLLVAWRDGLVGSREMLEEANDVLKGHGVEHLISRNGRAEAFYVNREDTYSTTVLLDTKRDKVWITSWGAWLEAEEKRGNKFD